MPHPLRTYDDEVQRLITLAFKETSYRLDRSDPIIAQYVVQKALLADFDEKQARAFNDFRDCIIPALKDEAKKMEQQRNRLEECSRQSAKDTVDRAGEDFLQRLRTTIRETDNTVLKDLDDHVERLQSVQKGVLLQIDEKNEEFAGTANQFIKTMSYFTIANGLLLVLALVVAVVIFGK
jgi:DNA anti-recombination protein RmuC